MVKDQTKRKPSEVVVGKIELNDVQDDYSIQEIRLDEGNETHWEVYNSAVDESTSTDEDCHHYENEVNLEEDVEQILPFLLELKEVEIGVLQIVKEELEQENTKLQEDIYLLKPGFLFN